MDDPTEIKPEESLDAECQRTKRNKNKRYWKAVRVAAVFSIIEAVSLVLWAESEDFSSPTNYYIRWLGKCGFLAGGAFVAYKLTGGKFKNQIVLAVWVCWVAICAILLIAKPAQPTLQFNVSLQIGNSLDDTVSLTNDFLFEGRFRKVGELPKGKILFNGLVNGGIIIPVQPNESNKVFNFVVENNSPVTVEKLEAGIGVPKDWHCTIDLNKWQQAQFAFEIPGWKMAFTNLQFFTRQTSDNLYPRDSFIMTITNPCPQTFGETNLKMGIVLFSLRADGFEGSMLANTLFLPASSNFTKPFVTDGEIGADGKWLPKITEEEFKKTQE